MMFTQVLNCAKSSLVVLMLSTRCHVHIIKILPQCFSWSSAFVCNVCFRLCSSASGITRFDLLGDFGRYNWLGNFYVVFLYNMMFAGLTSASLIKTVTWAVQRELIRAFGQFERLWKIVAVLGWNDFTLGQPCHEFPHLWPLLPDGLVPLPQIERIQFFQEVLKGQEESRVPPWGPSGTLPSECTHPLNFHPTQTSAGSRGPAAPRTLTITLLKV